MLESNPEQESQLSGVLTTEPPRFLTLTILFCVDFFKTVSKTIIVKGGGEGFFLFKKNKHFFIIVTFLFIYLVSCSSTVQCTQCIENARDAAGAVMRAIRLKHSLQLLPSILFSVRF